MSLPKVLENLKVAAEEAKALVADILITENVPPRLKMTVLILGDVAEIVTFHPKESDRAILLAADCCECFAVCIGEAEKAGESVCAGRIEIVLRAFSKVTALCAPLLN